MNIAKRAYGLSKIQTFLNALKTFALINFIRELIAQKFDDNGIHFLYARKFCRRPTSKVSASVRGKSLLGFD